MHLPINIEELLGGKAVENDRIEFKTGWNPDAIYRSICAFANDFDETGGGYIVVGVKEVNGRPVRPVVGIAPDQIESIEKEMVGYNNLMRPYYQPRLYIEEADEKTILVIKVSAGERRPYKVPDQITARQKTYNYYIRYNSSTIVPKDEYGSPKATIETDEERSYFLIDIPCHPEFVMEKVVLNKDFTKDFIKEKRMQISERQEKILFMIFDNDTITSQKIAQKTGVSQRTILNDLNKLQTMGILTRDGGRKNGTWVIVTT